MSQTVTTPATTPYDMIGGAAAVRAIVDRFYDLVERQPDYAALRAIHDADLGPVREGLAGFLTGWLGGPRDWFDQGKCVMSLHGRFAIDTDLARQWSEAMGRAINEQDTLPVELRTKISEAMARVANAMINRAI